MGSTKFGSMKNRGQRARALAQQQAQQQQMQQQQQAQHAAQQQLYQQSQQMNQVKKPMHAQQMQPTFQQQQAFLQQQLLIQKLAMQNLAKIQNQKAMQQAQQQQVKSQFNTSRWNETTPAQNQVHQQPELQLNMNSQGGFVPQFINNSPMSRAENNSSPRSESSFQSSTWSAPASPIGSSKVDSCWASSSSRWPPGLSNDWSSGTEDSGHASNDDDLDLDQEIFDQIAALRIEAH